MGFGGDSDLCSFRSSSFRSSEAGDGESNHVNTAKDDVIDYDNSDLGDIN